MDRRTLLLAAGATAWTSGARAAQAGLELSADLDAAVARAMALGVAPGLSVAVYSRDGVYAKGFGVTDVTTGEPVSSETAFYIASSTKSLTSLTFLALHQRGELDLEATLTACSPDAPLPPSVRPGEVRLRNLLSHTSGVSNEPLGFRVAYTGQHDPETLWRLLAASEPNTKAPLGKFEYTNTGYNIATVLTDRRLGVRWQDLLHRELFRPAGMTRTSAEMSPARAAGWAIARPHRMNAAGRLERIALEKTDQTMQSAGGVIMSARDAARFLELMVEDGRLGGRQVIPAQAVRASRVPLAVVADTFQGYSRDHYGLGWYLGDYRGEPMLHAFGGFAGFRAHVSYQPRRRIGVAVVVNDSTAAYPVVDAIANYAYDRNAGQADAQSRFDTALAAIAVRRDALVKRLAADVADRAARPWTLTRPRPAYAGAYDNAQWGRIEVSVEGEAMSLRFGALRSLAEPFTQPDSVRVEIIPGTGSAVVFEGGGPSPASLTAQGQRFLRLPA